MEIYPTKIPRNESTSQGMTRLTDLKHLVKSLDPKIKINTNTNTTTNTQPQSQSQIFSTSYSNPIDFLKIPPKTINQTSGSSRTLHLSSGYSLDEQEEMILDLRFEETKSKSTQTQTQPQTHNHNHNHKSSAQAIQTPSIFSKFPQKRLTRPPVLQGLCICRRGILLMNKKK
eukprot:Anaeramoba_flamelloidesc30427_g2_i1.p1 GENE.c30427_g2_i1~~c30427_g2_i1.p1  ORF type:complete len:172 (+),score=29.31 c30427_g2_i1:36-551(+)